MDPKNFAKLDPKLRETYERVMGTSIPQKPSVPPPPPTTVPSSTAAHTATAPAAPHIPVATMPAEPAIPQPSTVASTPEVVKPQPAGESHPATTAHQPEKSSVPTEPAHPHTTIAVHTAVAAPAHTEEKKAEAHVAGTPVPAWKKALFIIIGIAFFSAYAIFWLLFFKVQLPF